MWLNPRVHWIMWRLHAKIKGIILEIRKIYAFLGNSDKPTDDRKVTLPIWEKKLRKEKKPFPKLIKRNKLWQPEKVSDFFWLEREGLKEKWVIEVLRISKHCMYFLLWRSKRFLFQLSILGLEDVYCEDGHNFSCNQKRWEFIKENKF